MSHVHENTPVERASASAASAALLDDTSTEPLEPWTETELRLAIEAAASRILALIPTGVVEEGYPEET